MRTFAALVLAGWVLGGCLPGVVAAQSVTGASAAAPSSSGVNSVAADRPALDGGRIWSMGQPPTLKWQGSLTFDTSVEAALGVVGVEKEFGNPLAGIFGLRAEAVAGAGRNGAEGGLRLLATGPLLRLHAGLDYDARRGELDWLVGTDFNIRRGGLIGHGSRLRLGWLPSRDQTVQIGIAVPFGQQAGRTRPPSESTPLPSVAPPARRPLAGEEEARRAFRAAADAVARLTMPLRTRLHGNAAKAVAPDVAAVTALGPADEVLGRMIDAWPALFRATATASGEAPAALEAVAHRARRIVLEDVVLPFDGLLGQRRTTGTLYVFVPAAERRFAAELARLALPAGERAAAMRAFAAAIVALEGVRKDIWRVWHDDRRVFLPLQLALAANEADSQPELDRLLELATGDRFTEGNRVDYVVNEAFQFELARTVAATTRYHVLWIHDVQGEADRGNVDRVSALQVQSYLEALAGHVARYDDTGVLPEFHIILDQYFYELNNGRRWMTLLEQPLTHAIDHPPADAGTERGLRNAQGALRAAVAGSRRLQAQREQFGLAWLHQLIRVHVNITHPSDFSFWGDGLIPLVGMPDNLMRDHRKIVFYDVSEDDPTQGEALFSGMGLGEHYAGATWEDRALIVKGPATLALKAAARRVLERQGVTGTKLPAALRPRPLGPDYAAKAEAFRDSLLSSIIPSARVLQNHNDVGYGAKPATAAKAILLSAMPPGSVLMSPDSLWESDLWGSLLLGSALRGCRVLVVAPSAANSPGTSWLVLSRMHMLMSRLLALSQGLAPRIEAASGLFKVGFFNERAAVGDVFGRLEEARANFKAAGPWFKDLLPLSDAALEMLIAQARELARTHPPAYLVDRPGARPKLHMKGLFAVSRSAWDGIFAMPEMVEVLRLYMAERVRQVSGRERDVRQLPEAVWQAGREVIRARSEILSPEEVAAFVQYLQVGSSNMNDRSMLLDGEVALTVAGLGAQAGVVDFALVCGLSTWVERQEQIDALLPSPSPLKRLIALWGRSVL